MTKKNTRKNKQKLKRKNDLPKLASDTDFLCAFLRDDLEDLSEKQQESQKGVKPRENLNKHGLPFLDDYNAWMNEDSDPQSQDIDNTEKQEPVEPDDSQFSTLLEASLNQNHPPRKVPEPMPLKRRLKRYPPPEKDLDLHGFTAIGAQVKTRSFISSAHAQGFFTLRIVVGKGLHSEDGPVLPYVVEDVLKDLKKENIILSYKWELRKKLKSGALIVYLKRFDNYT